MSDVLLEIEDYRGGFYSETGELVPVLHGVSYALKSGVMTAVVGESGSGKSLVALSVLGIQPPAFERTGGRMLFRGADLFGLDERGLLEGLEGEEGERGSRSRSRSRSVVFLVLAALIGLGSGSGRGRGCRRGGRDERDFPERARAQLGDAAQI